MNNSTLNIKLPEELYNKLKEEAKRKNISLASLIRMVCTEYLESNGSKDFK